jgi:RimJ/RimL family protein N-acetyltransferase
MATRASRREHRRLLAHWEEHAFGWRGIFDIAAADGPLIGIVALKRTSGHLEEIAGPTIEIGWWVAPEQWGRGIATEAAIAARDEAFTDHGTARLVSQHMAANPVSGNVMRKIGMRHHVDTVGIHGEALRIFLLDRADWIPG